MLSRCLGKTCCRRSEPRKYGTQRIHLKRRAAHPLRWETVECFVYGKLITKTIKTFLATYRPAYGTIRVVIVQEEHGCEYFFSTDPDDTPSFVAGSESGTYGDFTIGADGTWTYTLNNADPETEVDESNETEKGFGTTWGEAQAGSSIPPSKRQTCRRE